jgi:uncharacterized damage-inducible protein DinB
MDMNRYPIGKFEARQEISPERRVELIGEISGLSARLRKSVQGITAAELDAPCREGGWTPRQIVHHIADCALNGFTRFKFALTQDNPALPAFDQETWAATADSAGADIDSSLSIMDGVSVRLFALLSSLAAADFRRTFRHPERGTVTVDFYLQLMAWHGKHHASQIEDARKARKQNS